MSVRTRPRLARINGELYEFATWAELRDAGTLARFLEIDRELGRLAAEPRTLSGWRGRRPPYYASSWFPVSPPSTGSGRSQAMRVIVDELVALVLPTLPSDVLAGMPFDARLAVLDAWSVETDRYG